MIQRFLHTLLHRNRKGFRVVHQAVLPHREALCRDVTPPLPEALQKSLVQMGISRLYTHQADAIECIRAGRNVVVATPTSSGKSLIYNLAVAEAFLSDPDLGALYLFPIKALSRDQMDGLERFSVVSGQNAGTEPFRATVYDGDTSSYQRAKIRQHPPHIVLSNPDMLHYALLAYHDKWEAFWRKLRFVVIDEMHTYRGIFGSHVAQIFRRLVRICRFYGSSPQFILLSATIANPEELAAQLIGRNGDSISVLRDHGAPQARRHFVFLEPEEAGDAHAGSMAARLIVQAARLGLKTIAFTQSRRLTELVHISVLRQAPELVDRVSSYRAGFLPEERRGIEGRLAAGTLSAVISTSALEMGIDIGGLDLCILVGYPGTVMTTWQRGGRVGRSGQESAIVLIPQPDALDQYIVHHPHQFLDSRFELAVTDPWNTEVLKAHLPCAAAELALHRREINENNALVRVVEELTSTSKLLQTEDGEEWISSAHHPHRLVDIRSVGPSFTILKKSPEGRDIPVGRNDGIRALKECHPGAVYLHRGETFQVEKLDLVHRTIHVTPCNVPYFTRVVSEKETEIIEVLASRPAGNFVARLGRLRVTEHIVGYEKRRLFSQERLDSTPLDLPPQTFETVGFWFEIEPLFAAHIQKAGLHFMGGIHAVEHAAISMFPLFALCDRNDIGGISCPRHPQVEKAAVFIYDGHPGGIGLAARGYDVILDLLEKTRELIATCTCSEGCPACIHSPKCGSGNKPLDKQAALAVLEYILGIRKITESLFPQEQEPVKSEPAPMPSVQRPPQVRIGFFDLETQRLAGEVGGWQNRHLMRVSLAVLHEAGSETFEVFREEDVPRLIRKLHELDLVVGFNVEQFDYGVLKAYTAQDLTSLPTFDMLKAINETLGFRLSLGHLAEKTLGKSKTSDGIQAVQWFREGRWDLLAEYCKMDVQITRDLFFHALGKGFLLYGDRRGRVLRVRTPWSLEELVASSKPGRS